jgi:hypothetical protein
MIVDALILVSAGILLCGGCFALWHATSQAWSEWRR